MVSKCNFKKYGGGYNRLNQTLSPVPNRLDPNYSDSYRTKSAMSDSLSRSTPHLARTMPHSTSPSPSRNITPKNPKTRSNTRNSPSPSPSQRSRTSSTSGTRSIPRPNNDDLNRTSNTGTCTPAQRMKGSRLKSARSTTNLTSGPYSDSRKRLKLRNEATKKVRKEQLTTVMTHNLTITNQTTN